MGVPRGLVLHVPLAPARLPDARPVEPTPGPAASAPANPVLGLGPRSRFRFHARDASSPVVPPSNLQSDPATTRRAGAVRKMPKISGMARWLAFGAVAVAAGAAGYSLGRPIWIAAENGEAPPDRVTDARTWTPGDRKNLDAILAAESRRQAHEMADMLARLRATRPELAGLPLLEARAAVAANSYANADAQLLRASREPLADNVEIAFARAANYGVQRKLDEMRRGLSDAIALDPTRAEFHFLRAEVDRRQARTQAALDGYDSALALARPGRLPGRETIAFRRRLLLIERGREREIDTKAYQAAFAQPAPPPDWMLTAAAGARQHKDAKAGALWLRAARASMPWSEYLERIDDYFFRNHADEPGMKELFPTGAERAQWHASAQPILTDP